MFGRKNIIIILLLIIIFSICFNAFVYATNGIDVVASTIQPLERYTEIEQSQNINFKDANIVLFIHIAVIISIINFIISRFFYKKNNSQKTIYIICTIVLFTSLVMEFASLSGMVGGVMPIETESELIAQQNRHILFNTINLIYLLAQIIIFIYLLVKIKKNKSETK